jgi:hypothetical protein
MVFINVQPKVPSAFKNTKKNILVIMSEFLENKLECLPVMIILSLTYSLRVRLGSKSEVGAKLHSNTLGERENDL